MLILFRTLENVTSDIELQSTSLNDRIQYARLNNFVSIEISISSGVPQGSHCGLLLFFLFVNDILNFINNSACQICGSELTIF